MKAYRIVQWERHENAESRKIRNLEWVSLPNKHDGLGFRMVARAADREALYGAWVTMVQVASRSERSRRGWLVRSGRPLGPEDLALMTGFRVKYFLRAFEFFQQSSLGWLELAECPFLNGESPGEAVELPGVVGESPSTPGESPGISVDGGKILGTKGREGKGRGVPEEKKGAGRVDGAAVKASVAQFAALQAQIRELERGVSELTAEGRADLRKKKARLRRLQAEQAEGRWGAVNTQQPTSNIEHPTAKEERTKDGE